MKYCFLIASIFLITAVFAETKTGPGVSTFLQEEVEMKQYYFVMLKKGMKRNEITDTLVLKQLQQGHMANIARLVKEGKIVIAGPFGDDGDWRGVFIFDADSREAVEKILITDPAIAAGRLDYEIHPWWTAKNCLFK